MIHALVLACCFVNTHPVGWGAVNLGLAALDYETAHASQSLALRNPCSETNRLFGSQHPSRATFYSRGLPLDLAIETSGWALYRAIPKKLWMHKVWRFPFAAVSYAHIGGIYSNITCR